MRWGQLLRWHPRWLSSFQQIVRVLAIVARRAACWLLMWWGWTNAALFLRGYAPISSLVAKGGRDDLQQHSIYMSNRKNTSAPAAVRAIMFCVKDLDGRLFPLQVDFFRCPKALKIMWWRYRMDSEWQLSKIRRAGRLAPSRSSSAWTWWSPSYLPRIFRVQAVIVEVVGIKNEPMILIVASSFRDVLSKGLWKTPIHRWPIVTSSRSSVPSSSLFKPASPVAWKMVLVPTKITYVGSIITKCAYSYISCIQID